MKWRLLIYDKDRADVSLLSSTRLDQEAIYVGHNYLGFGECHDICGAHTVAGMVKYEIGTILISMATQND